MALLPNASYKIDPLFDAAKQTFVVKAKLTGRVAPDTTAMSDTEVSNNNSQNTLQKAISDYDSSATQSYVSENVNKILENNDLQKVANTQNLIQICVFNMILDHLAGADFEQSQLTANTAVAALTGGSADFSALQWKFLISKTYSIDYYATHNLNLQKCARMYLSQLGFTNAQIDQLQQIIQESL